MKTKIKILIILAVLTIGLAPLAATLAQTATTTASSVDLITNLQATINQLQEKIKSLKEQIFGLESQVNAVKEELKITRTLQFGVQGDDVKQLQEFLKQFPEIYPEGLITGKFGHLTRSAIKKFQIKYNLESDGVLGARTVCTLKAVFESGAGKSEHTPPGLLIAPGIAKKIECEIKPLAGQILPFGIIPKLSTSTPIVCYDHDDDDDEEDKNDDDKNKNDDDDNDHNKKEKKEMMKKMAKRKCYFAPPTATSTSPIATSTDITAPIISNLISTSTTATSTIISWVTDESANGKIWYSASTPINATGTPSISSSALSLNHQFELLNLTASSTYYYAVSSADAIGNTASSSEKSFTTAQ